MAVARRDDARLRFLDAGGELVVWVAASGGSGWSASGPREKPAPGEKRLEDRALAKYGAEACLRFVWMNWAKLVDVDGNADWAGVHGSVGGNAGVVVPDRGRVVRVGSTDVNGFDLRLAAAASWSWSRLGSAAKVGEGRLGAVVVKGDKERPRLLANWDDVRECCRTIGENAACCSSWAMQPSLLPSTPCS